MLMAVSCLHLIWLFDYLLKHDNVHVKCLCVCMCVCVGGGGYKTCFPVSMQCSYYYFILKSNR